MERNCESCREIFNADECTKNGNYFLYLPTKRQIEDLLGEDKLKQYLKNHATTNRNPGIISDISSAELYSKLVESYNFSSNDLSLTWNTDGIPVFESSNYSIWPIQSAINELPPHLREKHILLHGPTRYYPYRGSPKVRTAQKQVEYGLRAIQKGEDVKGVKGLSVVGILPSFDQVRGKNVLIFEDYNYN